MNEPRKLVFHKWAQEKMQIFSECSLLFKLILKILLKDEKHKGITVSWILIFMEVKLSELFLLLLTLDGLILAKYF